MDILNIIGGAVLIAFGIWVTIVQMKKLVNQVPDTLGGNRSLVLVGIGCIIGGIIIISKHI